MIENEGHDEGQPARDDDPEEGDHLASPGPGEPVGETDSPGQSEPSEEDHEEPSDIGMPPGGDEDEQEATESPGSPSDPDSG